MKPLWTLLKADFKKMYEYKLLHILTAVSILLAAFMAFFDRIVVANYIYISMFIIPVIMFSMLLFIEKEDQEVVPSKKSEYCTRDIVLSKIISSLAFQLIPLFLYLIVMISVYHLEISYILFILAFLLGSLLHILIGLSLSIISKTNHILSLSYLTYIIFFSSLPIFYSSGLIPSQFEYAMMVSPAYLSGILIDDVLASGSLESIFIIITSVILQISYSFLLSYYVVKPFVKGYLEQYCNPMK